MGKFRRTFKTLQEKLNTYLHFVESGQIYTAYPDAKDRSIEITHYTKYPINDTGKAFINQANDFIKDIGITITTIQYDPEHGQRITMYSRTGHSALGPAEVMNQEVEPAGHPTPSDVVTTERYPKFIIRRR